MIYIILLALVSLGSMSAPLMSGPARCDKVLEKSSSEYESSSDEYKGESRSKEDESSSEEYEDSSEEFQDSSEEYEDFPEERDSLISLKGSCSKEEYKYRKKIILTMITIIELSTKNNQDHISYMSQVIKNKAYNEKGELTVQGQLCTLISIIMKHIPGDIWNLDEFNDEIVNKIIDNRGPKEGFVGLLTNVKWMIKRITDHITSDDLKYTSQENIVRILKALNSPMLAPLYNIKGPSVAKLLVKAEKDLESKKAEKLRKEEGVKKIKAAEKVATARKAEEEKVEAARKAEEEKVAAAAEEKRSQAAEKELLQQVEQEEREKERAAAKVVAARKAKKGKAAAAKVGAAKVVASIEDVTENRTKAAEGILAEEGQSFVSPVFLYGTHGSIKMDKKTIENELCRLVSHLISLMIKYDPDHTNKHFGTGFELHQSNADRRNQIQECADECKLAFIPAAINVANDKAAKALQAMIEYHTKNIHNLISKDKKIFNALAQDWSYLSHINTEIATLATQPLSEMSEEWMNKIKEYNLSQSKLALTCHIHACSLLEDDRIQVLYQKLNELEMYTRSDEKIKNIRTRLKDAEKIAKEKNAEAKAAAAEEYAAKEKQSQAAEKELLQQVEQEERKKAKKEKKAAAKAATAKVAAAHADAEKKAAEERRKEELDVKKQRQEAKTNPPIIDKALDPKAEEEAIKNAKEPLEKEDASDKTKTSVTKAEQAASKQPKAQAKSGPRQQRMKGALQQVIESTEQEQEIAKVSQVSAIQIIDQEIEQQATQELAVIKIQKAFKDYLIRQAKGKNISQDQGNEQKKIGKTNAKAERKMTKVNQLRIKIEQTWELYNKNNDKEYFLKWKLYHNAKDEESLLKKKFKKLAIDAHDAILSLLNHDQMKSLFDLDGTAITCSGITEIDRIWKEADDRVKLWKKATDCYSLSIFV